MLPDWVYKPQRDSYALLPSLYSLLSNFYSTSGTECCKISPSTAFLILLPCKLLLEHGEIIFPSPAIVLDPHVSRLLDSLEWSHTDDCSSRIGFELWISREVPMFMPCFSLPRQYYSVFPGIPANWLGRVDRRESLRKQSLPYLKLKLILIHGSVPSQARRTTSKIPESRLVSCAVRKWGLKGYPCASYRGNRYLRTKAFGSHRCSAGKGTLSLLTSTS